MKNRLKSSLYWILQQFLFVCRPHKNKNLKHTNLIYKPDAIGDFLLATGVIRELLERCPGEWTLVCSPAVKEVAHDLFPDLSTVVMQGSNRIGSGNPLSKFRSLRPFCRSHRVETLVCLRHSLSGMDHVLLNWMSPRESAGIHTTPIPTPTPGPYRHFQFTHIATYPRQRGNLPLEIHAHMSVLNALLDTPLLETECIPFLKLADVKPNDPPELAVFPVTRSRLRNYPLPKLADAVNRFLAQQTDYQVCLYGTPEDASTLDEFRILLHSPHPVRIEFPDSILDAVKRIQQASLVLGMDSAPAHISILSNKKGIFILAGAQYNHFAPWGDPKRQIWLSYPLPCYHCNWACKYPEPFCITNIESKTISNHLLHLERIQSPSS